MLPPIEDGDIIHLKLVNSFEYLIKGTACEVNSENIEANIESIFDWHGQGQITAADITEIVGKNLKLHRKYVHKVIKK